MTLAELSDAVRRDGYAFAQAADIRALLSGVPSAAPPGWASFADSWNDLRPDEYMADGGRYRLRRHAVLSAGPGAPRLEPAQPHYQSRDYNALNGGVARWFEPVAPDVIAGPTMARVLGLGCGVFGRLMPGASWKIELHQFRIEAKAGVPGLPTPEGVHRDGVDFALVMLVRRENVASGTTTVHDLEGKLLGGFTLTEPFDAAIVDDNRVTHGVTPVVPLDPSRPAYRDVLVATFLKKP
jgi:hypothetical protein